VQKPAGAWPYEAGARQFETNTSFSHPAACSAKHQRQAGSQDTLTEVYTYDEMMC